MTTKNAPEPHDSHYEAGLALIRDGHYAQAIEEFERALNGHPDDLRVLFVLGNTAAAIGHAEAAENFFGRVLKQEPDRVEALVQLANLWRKRGRTADIVALLKPAIARNPSAAELWLTLGSALRESGDAATAEIFYREALRLVPDYPPALGNLADLLADGGAVDEALDLHAQVIAQEPENAQARLNRAILFLVKGNIEEGWSDYEYRLRIKERALIANHRLAPWEGSVSDGLRLLVTAEQGIGDQVMFASLVPELAQSLAHKGGRVILEAEPRLVPLFARSFPGVKVMPARLETRGGATRAHYDWLAQEGGADATVPVASLPRLLRTDLSRFPRPHSYLKPDENERARWAHWLREAGPPPYIGLCWRSGRLGGLRGLEYAPLEAWAGFIDSLPGTPVSLQYDGKRDEIEKLQALSGRTIAVPPGLDQKQEIDRAAAMIAALDAAISAPTSVAWIAAGLGVLTLKLLYKSSWTSLGCDYEPFAPACRCVMPVESGDWADAFAKAKVALIEAGV